MILALLVNLIWRRRASAMEIEVHRGQSTALRTDGSLLGCWSVDPQSDLSSIDWDLDVLDMTNFGPVFNTGRSRSAKAVTCILYTRRRLPKAEDHWILSDFLYIELVCKFPASNVLIVKCNILWREPRFELGKERVMQ